MCRPRGSTAGQRPGVSGGSKTTQIYEGANQVQRIGMERQFLERIQSEL